MRKYLVLTILVVSVLFLPRLGFTDSFWLGFGMSSGYGYGGGYYGGCSGYVPVTPVIPVVPVVPYYGGGCSATTIIHHGSAWGYGPVYHYHYRPYYRNWYDNPYYGPSYRPRKYYYGGAYHPAPPPPQYYRGRCRPRRQPRVHINNCNNCDIYGKRRR